jgi:hypothetical protein
MSWIDRITNIELKVTTGEGSEFFPLYKNATRSVNMNASVFNFNEVQGSLVRRGFAESFKYPFEFHFTGEDHIDEVDRFMIASRDRRAWTITHPVYGDFLAQPINLNQSDAAQNDSVITGELFETIPDTFPDSSIDVKEDVTSSAAVAIESLSANFAAITTPTPKLTSTASSSINQISNEYKATAVTDIDLQAVQNASNAALSTLANIANDPVTFMNRTAELLITPVKFYASINDRINIILESYAQDIADEQDIDDNKIKDYNTRQDVVNIADTVKAGLDEYLNTLGDLQSDVDATPDSFTPKQISTNALKETVNKATGQLLQIAVETRQERNYTIPYNVGLIVLVHRLLGTTDSEEIQSFAKANRILLSEWLQINKGRKVIYYI